MITRNRSQTLLTLGVLAITGFAFNGAAEAKPLKVDIMAGQSNMQGQADEATQSVTYAQGRLSNGIISVA